jgi:hypothetical protein
VGFDFDVRTDVVDTFISYLRRNSKPAGDHLRSTPCGGLASCCARDLRRPPATMGGIVLEARGSDGRLQADEDVRRSIAWLSERAEKARAAGQDDLATFLDHRATNRANRCAECARRYTRRRRGVVRRTRQRGVGKVSHRPWAVAAAVILLTGCAPTEARNLEDGELRELEHLVQETSELVDGTEGDLGADLGGQAMAARSSSGASRRRCVFPGAASRSS